MNRDALAVVGSATQTFHAATGSRNGIYMVIDTRGGTRSVSTVSLDPTKPQVTPVALNGDGTIVGYALSSDFNFSSALIWSPSGALATLPAGPYANSMALGINNGVVVGSSSQATTPFAS